eukprot:6144813-Pyramimonas_sp.AAC.1
MEVHRLGHAGKRFRGEAGFNGGQPRALEGVVASCSVSKPGAGCCPKSVLEVPRLCCDVLKRSLHS